MGNYAFIDSQNVYLSLRNNMGWELDYSRLRIYLKEKYNVEKAYIFIGYIETNQRLYTHIQKCGFTIIFKPTLTYKNGTTKGNCDAELVLQAMIDYVRYDKAVIISGDGDFYCLADHLAKNSKLQAVVVPDKHRYSALLKRINTAEHKYLAFMNDLRKKLERIPRK